MLCDRNVGREKRNNKDTNFIVKSNVKSNNVTETISKGS